jgi:hypothetical protein
LRLRFVLANGAAVETQLDLIPQAETVLEVGLRKVSVLK